MCTTDERDAIIADLLVARTGMTAGYARWFVAQLNDDQRQFATRAAAKNRKQALRSLQRLIRVWHGPPPSFPGNTPRAARRRKARPGSHTPPLFV